MSDLSEVQCNTNTKTSHLAEVSSHHLDGSELHREIIQPPQNSSRGWATEPLSYVLKLSSTRGIGPQCSC
jgi:hypothetical protein